MSQRRQTFRVPNPAVRASRAALAKEARKTRTKMTNPWRRRGDGPFPRSRARRGSGDQ